MNYTLIIIIGVTHYDKLYKGIDYNVPSTQRAKRQGR